MTAKRALGLVMVWIAFLLAPTAGFAQDNTSDAAPAPTTPPSADAPAAGTSDAKAPEPLPWLKFCGDLPDGKGQLCLVRQLVFAQNQPIARFILRNNPEDKSPLLVMASMPLGVTLPYGLRMQIDNGRELALPYIACDSQMCNVRTSVDESFVTSLKRGAVLKLKAKNARGDDVTVEIDLKGFTAVYDGDKYVSLNDAQAPQQNTATEKLGQAVQDLAEQIRRQKEGSADTSAPATDAPAAPAGN
nr:invasion associated locus B family protein [uncultured Sphaerochaeta sp.]